MKMFDITNVAICGNVLGCPADTIDLLLQEQTPPHFAIFLGGISEKHTLNQVRGVPFPCLFVTGASRVNVRELDLFRILTRPVTVTGVSQNAWLVPRGVVCTIRGVTVAFFSSQTDDIHDIIYEFQKIKFLDRVEEHNKRIDLFVSYVPPTVIPLEYKRATANADKIQQLMEATRPQHLVCAGHRQEARILVRHEDTSETFVRTVPDKDYCITSIAV